MKRFATILVATFLLLNAAPAFAQDTPEPEAPAAAEPAAEAMTDAGVTPAVPAVTEAPEASEEKPESIPTDADPVDTAEEMVQAVKDGKWLPAGMLLLILCTWLLRKVAGEFDKLSFFESRLGGYVLVFVSATAGSIAASMGAGMEPDLKLFTIAVTVGFAAIGGWETLKDVLGKKDEPEEEEA